MKNINFFILRKALKLLILILLCGISFFLLNSFSYTKNTLAFLEQVGLHEKASQDIMTSILIEKGYYVPSLQKAKVLTSSRKKMIVTEAATYAQKYILSESFQKLYKEKRERNKPTKPSIQTPDQFRSNHIAQCQQSWESLQATYNKADVEMKKLFKSSLDIAKKNLDDARDPKNPMYEVYKTNYELMISTQLKVYEQQLKTWEDEYPIRSDRYILSHLLKISDELQTIDYTAKTIEKSGKQYFEHKPYESKSKLWKAGYRAGKEIVDAILNEIKKYELSLGNSAP